MNRTRWLVAALWLTGPWCLAGEAEPPAGARTEAAAPAAFDLSFKGGTLKSLLEQVEKAAGSKPNAICSEEALGRRVPGFSLADTNLEAILLAVAKIDPDLLAEKDASGNFIVVIRPKEGISQRFYNLKPYLGQYTLEQINALIQAAWELIDEEDKGKRPERPKLRFHEETGIMIVVGNRRHLGAADALLKELDEEKATPGVADAGDGK